MAELENQLNNIPASIKKKHNKSLLAVLLSMSKAVGVQADQKFVSEVLAIIDDLISYEIKTKQVEYDVEQRRIARFTYDRKRQNVAVDFLDAQVKDIFADYKTAETRFKELSQDRITWKTHVHDKKQQLVDMEATCNDQISTLTKANDQYNANLDLIRQVIIIFKSKAIQDIKSIVKDINA